MGLCGYFSMVSPRADSCSAFLSVPRFRPIARSRSGYFGPSFALCASIRMSRERRFSSEIDGLHEERKVSPELSDRIDDIARSAVHVQYRGGHRDRIRAGGE